MSEPGPGILPNRQRRQSIASVTTIIPPMASNARSRSISEPVEDISKTFNRQRRSSIAVSMLPSSPQKNQSNS